MRWRAALLRGGLLAGLALLTACMPVRRGEDDLTLAAQRKREAALAGRTHWTLEGRIAVSNGDDGGNGDVHWVQDGANYDFTLHAPVTGKTWRLHGDARRSELEGLREGAVRGGDPGELLERQLGWHVPVAELGYWARALRAPGGGATVTFDQNDRPALLEQGGWKVEYRDWFDDTTPPMPRKVFATRGKYRVRLFVEGWTDR